MHRRQFCSALLSSMPIVLAGCETEQSLKSEAEWTSARSDPSESIVLGRLRWIENGEELGIDPKDLKWSMPFRLKRLEDQRYMNGKLGAGGHFRWSLPPGTYLIDRIVYREFSGNYFVVPKVMFRVPEAGGVYYAGTLRVDAATTRGFFGVSGAMKFSIVDEYKSELSAIEAALGVRPDQVEKRLMVQDDRLPDSIDNSSEAQLAITLLGAFL